MGYGYEYSMNVFICGNLTNENLDIIKKIFKEESDKKSYSQFEPRAFDFDIYFALNKPLKNYEFYWV